MELEDWILLGATVGWTIWLVAKSFGTECFSMLDSYVTIILLYAQLILIYLNKE